MSRIKVEIAGCMVGLTREDRSLSAHFLFPEEFIGFQGHFPGQKILPGLCQVDCVLVVIEQGEATTATLREILLAKYTAPVLPGTELLCNVQRVAEENGSAVFKAQLTTQGKKVTEMKLRVALQTGTE